MEDYSVLMKAAIMSNDSVKFRELLEEASEPIPESMMSLAVESKQVEIIQTLVEYGCKINTELIDYICESENLSELLVFILQLNPNDTKLVQKFFCRLVLRHEEPIRLRMFNILLDYGLPINDFIDDTYTHLKIRLNAHECREVETIYGVLTPIHLAVLARKIGFTSLLIERGADVNKKTSNGVTTLALAMKTRTNISIFKMLLKKVADINEKTIFKNGNILHVFFEIYDAWATVGRPYDLLILRLLLDHGADPNALNDYGHTPLPYACLIHEYMLVKQLAKLAFEGHPISPANLKAIQEDTDLRKMFEDCKEELQRLRDIKFYGSFSLYDVLKMQNQEKRLIALTKNEDFVIGFVSCWNVKSFTEFGRDLNGIFNEALEKRDILLAEEKKLRSVLKDYLPELVICNVAYFATEHMFIRCN